MDKLSLYLMTSMLAFSNVVASQEDPTYLEEVKALGLVAGQGLACKASKYETYELLARAYIISKASDDDMQEAGMRAYNSAKVNTYVNQRNESSGCSQIRKRFDEQPLFKSTLYGDGTIKTPDGKIITPRQPYDASLIYQKDPKIFEKLEAMTLKAEQEATKNAAKARAASRKK